MSASGWRLNCAHCSFESATSARNLAESMAATHESATGHTVDIREQGDG